MKISRIFTFSLVSTHLDVHVFFTEEVKEAGHHLDILDLDDNITQNRAKLKRKPERQYEPEPPLLH